ncbi:MAG: hypothetical protein Q9157_002441 [Trypethelium eluteriae]
MHTFKKMTLGIDASQKYPLTREKLTPGLETINASPLSSPHWKDRNWRVRVLAVACVLFLYCLWLGYWPSWGYHGHHGHAKSSGHLAWEAGDPAQPECLYDNLRLRDTFMSELREMIDWPYPLDMYGATGRRAVMLQRIAPIAAKLDSECRTFPAQSMTERFEHALAHNYPFLHNLSITGAPTAWRKLKQRFEPNSRGIVITIDEENFRHATHLISNLRNVVKTDLPIQVAYAGIDSIGSKNLELLSEINPDIELLNLLSIFDDSYLSLDPTDSQALWVLKPFAVLASKFEHVVGLDPDVVLLQPPENLLNSSGYAWRGISVFQDGLVPNNDRAAFLEWTRFHKKAEPFFADMDKPWKSDSSPLIDGGMVAIDKSRFPVLLALLQACWLSMGGVRDQEMGRSKNLREEVWMAGPELVWTDYYMHQEFGTILKDDSVAEDEEGCGYKFAHVDDKGKLFWYGGGLSNPGEGKSMELLTPTRQIESGYWIKELANGGSNMICTNDTEAENKIGSDVTGVLQKLTNDAQQLDRRYERYFSSARSSSPSSKTSSSLREVRSQSFG